MGELHRVLVAANEPGAHQLFDQLLALRIRRDLSPRHPVADRLAFPVRGDQPQEQVAQGRSLSGRNPLVQLLCGARDGPAHSPGLAIPLDGQGVSLPSLPGLTQHVRQKGQRAGLALDFADQEIDESRLDTQPRLTSRPSMALRRLSSSMALSR